MWGMDGGALRRFSIAALRRKTLVQGTNLLRMVLVSLVLVFVVLIGVLGGCGAPALLSVRRPPPQTHQLTPLPG
jgi:hypothetical protein